MSAIKQGTPFRPPVPRPQPELWYAIYALPRKAFLDAVEKVVPQLLAPREGVHWEFEGFNRHKLFLCPVADSEDSSEYFQTVEFGLDAAGSNVHISVESAAEDKILLFKRLLAELDSLDDVAQACITPCSLLDDGRG